MKLFLKKNLLGLLGLLIGLIGILLSIFFYTKTLTNQEPVFVVDPNRTEIISADRVSKAPLKVVRTEGGEIFGDISSVRVYLWNRGNISIKSENILQPLRLILDDSKGEILDFQVMKTSREVVTPEITRYPEDPKLILSVNFKILEQNDGFCIQIIYVGSPSANFTIKGQIEGVPYLIGSSQIEESRFWLVYLGKVKTFFILFIVAISAILCLYLPDLIAEYLKQKASRLFMVFKISLGIFLISFFIFLIFWILIIAPVKDSKKEARQSLVESVPSSIVPLKESIKMPIN